MVVSAPAPEIAARTETGPADEVLVLRGDDRIHLRERALDLAATVERQGDVTLAELAASLAAELQPGGARLAVVGSTSSDLAPKLSRAAARLADPKCTHIRDSAGVYFSDQPLFLQGPVALLFPGEGAQYPGMFQDLCGAFPEVEETFAWCDELAAQAGRPSLRRILHPPPEEREAAEAELRKLGPSIFGVLVADLAIARLLQNLELPVAAVAGHSAGELAALMAAGAMGSESLMGPKLVGIMDLMQRQEDEAGGADVALLAVGAGKATVQEVAAAVAGGSVIVAMDNCPHQCVAVGPAHQVAAVEAALLERGLVCERLPFRRPYHTPLFEPWMGTFRELFAGIPFDRPHTPVYSCSTGDRFPDDPDAIRRLAVDHWVNPVEFARMVEVMYADGVRLFVEAGPRGNLSAFVEDILRGRPFAAVPANLPRKSGPTQFAHLVAQLAAHHVPLKLGHRSVRAGSGSDGKRETVAPAPGPDGHAIMHGYLAAMEQFLAVQQEVMQAFLTGRSTPATVPPELFEVSEHSPLSTQHSAPAYALVGEVVRHEPGRSIVTRRPLDEREDLYADDHTLGGRGVSHVDPGQNGLPVVPMTFSLEAMAEAATLLVPDKVVVAIRNVRLFRWLPFDPEPTTLEVRAAVASADPQSGTVEVKADVRDLGNSFLRDGANKPACEAVIVLADRYPEPPEPRPFRLTGDHPCVSTVEKLRRNMFHGPLFQMLQSLGRIGPEGIEGELEVKPRDRWFRSTTEPVIVLDPVLTDAAMHVLGAWHLEQPDWSGRILLPIGLQSLEYFGPPPPPGTRMMTRGHNEEETARQVRHGMEVFGPDGRIWLRLTGASYWRFYLPFAHINFFGPKDEYYLSRRLPEAEVGSTECGARNAEPKTEARSSDFGSALRTPHSALGRCYFLDPPVDLKQPVMRAAGARVTMTPRELAEFRAWACTDAELNDWFFGRMLAKDAVRAAWAAKHGEAMFPADIETEVAGGRIVCRPRGEAKPEPFPPVAVAIAGGKVAAFAAFAEYVGVALVAVAKGEPESEVRSRAARAALAEALGLSAEGLAAGAGPTPGLVHVAHAGRKLRVQTARHGNLIVATTTCEAEPA